MRLPLRFPFAALAAGLFACSAAIGQLQGSYLASLSQPIPSAGTGGSVGWCGPGSSDTTSVTISVADAFVLSNVRLQLLWSHTKIGDLTITLAHCGVSVAIYDQVPASTSDVSGAYTFDDAMPNTFAVAVGAQSAAIPSGWYAPVNPLSAFDGMSSAGDWTITVCDHSAGDVGTLGPVKLDLDGKSVVGGPVVPALAIPDGDNAGCVDPVARAINVTSSGLVDTIEVTLGIDHTFVRDLEIAVIHDGVVVTLSDAGTMIGGVGAQGLYTFANPNGTLITFDAAATAAAPSGNIAPGTYLPDQPLSAFAGHSQIGVWTIIVCDSAHFDTGTITEASIAFSSSPYALTLSQPSGPASLILKNSGGSPGHAFVNFATLMPGNFPNGWLNGLDISIIDVVMQLSFGSPFVGVLGPCGGSTSIVIGPIPSGLSVQLTSFELDFTAAPIASVPAFQYQTL